MPTPPTATPFLYSGIPPGSPARPSGKPAIAISEQGKVENWTPYSGPPGRLSIPGGKCSWIMKDAVRVVNAFPPVEKIPAVPAFELAAAADETDTFSRPWPAVPTLLIRVIDGAPVIANVPSRLPSSSVTETVTLALI